MVILSLFRVPPVVSDSSQILPVDWHLCLQGYICSIFGLFSVFATSPVTRYFFPSSPLWRLHNSMEVPRVCRSVSGSSPSLCSSPCLLSSLSLLFSACSFSEPRWGNILLSCWHWFFSYTDIASSCMMGIQMMTHTMYGFSSYNVCGHTEKTGRAHLVQIL